MITFEDMYEESLKRLDNYISTQVTENQIIRANNRKQDLIRNKTYLKGRFDHLYFCCKCGILESTNYIKEVKEQMESSQTCFHCNYWAQLAKTPDKNRLVIDGHIYSDGGNKPKENSNYLGFGGTVFKIKQGDRIWETNNLWSGDTIPQEFIEYFPNNAEFVS